MLHLFHVPIFEACFDVPNTDWVKIVPPRKLEMEASLKPVPPRTNPRMNEAKSAFAFIVKAAISGKTRVFKGRFPVSREKSAANREVTKGRSFVPHADAENRKLGQRSLFRSILNFL